MKWSNWGDTDPTSSFSWVGDREESYMTPYAAPCNSARISARLIFTALFGQENVDAEHKAHWVSGVGLRFVGSEAEVARYVWTLLHS